MAKKKTYGPIFVVEVKPKSGKRTRLQNYKKKVKGKPDMKPTKNPKVTKNKGDRLRIIVKDIYADNGDIVGADGRSYNYVIDDPVNGNAAKLYVKMRDVEYTGLWGEIYTVKKGDNLTKIAKDVPGYGFSNKSFVDLIYEANKKVIGKDKNLIKPGQKLWIPGFRRG